MKYLFIFEDGYIATSDHEPTACDKDLSDDGCLSIIRISDCKEFNHGKWAQIPTSRIEHDKNAGDYTIVNH